MHVLAAYSYFFHNQGQGYVMIIVDTSESRDQISSANVTELVSLFQQEVSSSSYLYENQLTVQLNI